MPSIIYNAANIQSWQNEAIGLRAQLQQQTQLVKDHNQALIPLQTRFQLLQSQINSVQSQITVAEIRSAEDRNYHSHLTYPHHHHHPHRPGLLHTVGDVLSAMNLNALYNELRDLQNQSSHIERDMRPHLQHIDTSNAIIQRATQRIQWLDTHIANGPVFLNNLRTNPHKLVTQLKKDIADAFKLYDDTHPTERSVQVRICLYNLQEKLNYFLLLPQYVSTRNLQITYLQLCSVLQDMHQRVKDEGKDSEFSTLLSNLLEHTYISLNGDLPDDLQTGQTTSHYHADLERQNTLFAISPERLMTLEQEHYEEELKYINSRVVIQNELQNKINSAVNVLSAEVDYKKQHNQFIDYHFYNRVLQDLHQVSAYPKDHATTRHLSQLASVAAGAPSIGKKVAGALMAVVGVILIAASVACLAATFGGSALASGFGMGLGVSLLSSQVVLGVSSSLTALTGMGLTFWGGFKFKEGLRQGLSKELEGLNDELAQPTYNH